MAYESTVGLRYLLSKKGDFFVSVITLISIFGVALGVMALLVVMGVLSGFEESFRDKILGNSSHLIVVEPGSRYMDNSEEQLHTIESVEGVTAASPFLYEEVLVSSRAGKSGGLLLYGVDPTRVRKVIRLEDDMVSGSLSELEQPDGIPGIVLGYEVAHHVLYAVVGDVIDVLSPQGEVTPFGVQPKIRRFRVVGVFKSGLYEYDLRTAYIHLDQAQSFLETGNRISGIQARVDNVDLAGRRGGAVGERLGDRFLVRTWMDLNSGLFSAFAMEKKVFFIVLTMIILVAAFNIIGTLILVVTEKSREIAILRAIGAQRSSIRRIFMVTGSTIGVIGTALGLILGGLLIVLLRDVIEFPLDANVYQLDRLPVSIHASDFMVVAAAALLISVLSTLYPALQASRMNPIESLRYE